MTFLKASSGTATVEIRTHHPTTRAECVNAWVNSPSGIPTVLCYVQGTARQHCNFPSTGLTTLATQPSTPPIRPSGPVTPAVSAHPLGRGPTASTAFPRPRFRTVTATLYRVITASVGSSPATGWSETEATGDQCATASVV
jgi:hypothetical protein